MSKTVLITGAGSGFGKGAALELARRGHKVIAATHLAAQKTALLDEAERAGVKLQVEVLDITSEPNRQAIFKHEIDVLVNNAGISEGGPVADIPMENVRGCFETNVFGTLAMTQGFVPQMVQRGFGKVIIVSSVNGLFTVPFVGTYCATKHALEALAEAMKDELAGTGVEVCVVNPGPFGTGFNERGADTMASWFNQDTSSSRADLMNETMGGLQKLLQNQLDPQIMVDALARIVEEDASKFRNVIPDAMSPWIQSLQSRTWDVGKEDALWEGFPE